MPALIGFPVTQAALLPQTAHVTAGGNIPAFLRELPAFPVEISLLLEGDRAVDMLSCGYPKYPRMA